MTIKAVNSKKEFLKMIEDNGYDKVATFLVYPHSKNVSFEEQKLSKKESVLLAKKDIDNGSFADAINFDKDNNIMFVGLNSAERSDEDNKKREDFPIANSYQTMHDISSKSMDYNISETLKNFDKEAYGSFAMDVMNKFVQTNVKVSWVNKLCEEIKENKKIDFDSIVNMNDVEPFDPYENNKQSKDRSDNAKRFHEEIDRKEKEIEEMRNRIDNLNKEIDELKKNYDDENDTLGKLKERFIKYDVPAFVGIVKSLNPKKLVCFGDKSYKLVYEINKVYFDNGIKVKKVYHYSSPKSLNARIDDMKKALIE